MDARGYVNAGGSGSGGGFSPTPLPTGHGPQNYRAVGVVGMLLFTSILAFSGCAIVRRWTTKSLLAQLFTSLCCCVCLCELPRYIMYIIYDDYTSRWAYACHLLGTGFYFATLTVIVSSVIEVITERHVMLLTILKAANVLFMLWIFYAMYRCLTAPSLDVFFVNDDDDWVGKLDFYDVYSIVDVGKNLLLFGVTQIAALCRLCAVQSYARTIHNIAVQRQIQILVNALVLSCICFLLRCIMISLKLIALEGHGASDDPDRDHIGDLALYGLWWSILSDFIPRTGPLIIFLRVFTHPQVCCRGFGCLLQSDQTDEEKLDFSETNTTFSLNDALAEALVDTPESEGEGPLLMRHNFIPTRGTRSIRSDELSGGSVASTDGPSSPRCAPFGEESQPPSSTTEDERASVITVPLE